jgi:hypothetical protein
VRVEQRWTAGWDLFREPLDFTHSNIVWSLNPATKTLTVSFLLVHANPLYQMSFSARHFRRPSASSQTDS